MKSQPKIPALGTLEAAVYDLVSHGVLNPVNAFTYRRQLLNLADAGLVVLKDGLYRTTGTPMPARPVPEPTAPLNARLPLSLLAAVDETAEARRLAGALY